MDRNKKGKTIKHVQEHKRKTGSIGRTRLRTPRYLRSRSLAKQFEANTMPDT